MRKTWKRAFTVAWSAPVLAVIAAGSQEATEIFIPIGQSPNLSDRVTVIGTVESVDAGARTIVVKSEGGSATATITDKTRIYVDRSQRKESNRLGVFEDLRTGARVEVLYEGRARAASGPAEWVKVELPAS
jgi:hypothetical protein